MVKPKDAQVNVKVTPETKEQYYKVAADYGLNLSEWAREAMRYVATNKPLLGKSYAPEGQSLATSLN